MNILSECLAICKSKYDLFYFELLVTLHFRTEFHLLPLII